MKKAIVLLSGGLDSATVLYFALKEGYEIHSLSFDYGQKHKIELQYAKHLASIANTHHRQVIIDTSLFLNTALVNSELVVPKNQAVDQSNHLEIPITYVPGRNILFLAHALSLAESIESSDIFIGVNSLDYSGYPDCRPEFIASFEKMANLGTKAGIGAAPFRIRTPLIHMTKAEIIQTGTQLGVDYGATNSCYDPDPEGKPCLGCDSCLIRQAGFKKAGIVDPLITKFSL